MPEFISRIQQQIKDLWQNLDKSQKSRIYITSAILFVAMAVGIVLLTRPNYMTLIRNADSKEVGEMTKVLDTVKIKYKVSNDSSSITINANDNNSAQAALVQAGYPKTSGLTFDDAMTKISITTTESEKRKIWQREEESNIAAKLKKLDNVEDASVALALPEQTVFVSEDKEQQKTKASVMVKPREELSKKQVQGIVMMVARSVEGLDPKDVTVVDYDLNVLNSETGDPAIDSANSNDEMRLKRKNELEKSVRDFFMGRFDNFDNLRVVANPVLDFNKEKSQIQDVKKPEGMDDGAVISSETKQTDLVNSGTGNLSPGMTTNPGTGTSPSYPTTGDGNSTLKEKTETINRKYTEILTDTEKALGVLDTEKSTMAVVLLYGARVTDESKITPELINQIKDNLSGATGLPAANIKISKLKIAPPEQVKVVLADTIKKLVETYGFFALILLLMTVLLIVTFPRRKRVEEPALSPLQPATATGPRFIVPEASGEPLPEIEFEERSEVKKQIEKFVKQRPEAVAQLLRNWISEEWD